jgi:hypothetical protein
MTGPIYPQHAPAARFVSGRQRPNQKGLNGSITLLLVTPVCAQLSFLSQWPGAPEQDRSANPIFA